MVEVDDVRCVELIDDVWTTAALTKEREVYMVLVQVVHIFCAAAAGFCNFCARGRKANGRGAGERARERARARVGKCRVCYVPDARRAASPSARRGGGVRHETEAYHGLLSSAAVPPINGR